MRDCIQPIVLANRDNTATVRDSLQRVEGCKTRETLSHRINGLHSLPDAQGENR